MSLLYWLLDSSVTHGTERRGKKNLQMLQNQMENLQVTKALDHLQNRIGQARVPDELLSLTADTLQKLPEAGR